MISVMLIDDEPLTTQALRKVIETCFPYIEIVGEFSSSLRAWEQIQIHRPDFIVTDIRMPDLDGLQLIARIVEADLPVKVLLVTAHGEFEYAHKAIQLGASGYLLKPFSQNELVHDIHRMVQRVEEERKTKGLASNISQVIPVVEERAMLKLLSGTMNQADLHNFVKLTGDKWKRCHLIVFQFADNHSRDIEEITKISIVEEINSYLTCNSCCGIAFFRSGLELAIVYTELLQDHSINGLPEPSLVEACANIVKMYLTNTFIAGMSGRAYGLNELTAGLEDARQNLALIGQEQDRSSTGVSANVSQQDMLIEKALEFCTQYFTNHITLQMLADHLHMNKNYFCNLFKEKMNVTFWEHITNLRIEKAKQMLVAGNEKINDIAIIVGYLNASHFGRIFKKATGVTPADYRRLAPRA